MRNIKKMYQHEYDNYLTLEVIPELVEEFGSITTIILKNNRLQFAKTCDICGDYIVVGKEYDLCKEMLDFESDVKSRYFEILTEFDVVDQNQLIECECETEKDEYFDSFDEGEEDIIEDEDSYLDLDDDYGDGNYEY